MRIQAISRFALITGPLLLASCTQGPDYVRPEVATPPQFRSPTTVQDTNSLADAPWWEVFNDPVLQDLIDRTLKASPDIAVAAARVEQARALVGVARSEAVPKIDYNAGIAAEQTFIPLPNAPTDAQFWGWKAGLSTAWELDIWGRIKRSTEAAEANMFAEQEVQRGVLLSLVTDVAANYFQLLALDHQLRIAETSAGVYGENVNFFTARFKAGRDTRLPVERSEANYAHSQNRIADLKRQIAIQENAIAILTGGYPDSIPRGPALDVQTLPEVPVGTTTVLLQRRPDIRRAEQMMISANAQVGVAAANFFPRIGLGAFFGGQSLNFENSINETFAVWNVAGAITGPLFDGGKLRSEKRNREAYWDEMVANYRKTILTGFKETSDALYSKKGAAERRAALETQVAALQRSVDLSMARFKAGRANYFEVLEAEQQLYPAQYALVEARRDQLVSVVALYKALGGGWQLRTDQWSRGSTPASATVAPDGK
ncbi:MAG TPA: efflux transporter outer membrane subunit [Novosphingobium sp.]